MEPLDAISPIDGRYRPRTEKLAIYFSERALILRKAWIEIEYLKALAVRIGRPLSTTQTELVSAIFNTLVENDGEVHLINTIDKNIRHDTKAIEYYLKEKFKMTELESYAELIHFGLTSADVDNTALAINLREFVRETLIPEIVKIEVSLTQLASSWKTIPMLGRTHGRPAVPTTLGKEIVNFAVRIHHQKEKLANIKFYGKLNGAVGNFNAHYAAFSDIDWILFSERFIRSIGLEPIPYSTQIPAYDRLVEFLDTVRLTNSILSGFSQDIWRYISDDYLTLTAKNEEVGSSTMPQKVNPIDFEMAESALSSANALIEDMSRRLPTNRLQRDLTDKYVLRNLGTAMAYTHIGLGAIRDGLLKISPNEGKMRQDLETHWEIVAEGMQTILRAAGQANAYELLKEKTRGRAITREDLIQFIESLDVAEDLKTRLRALSPLTYIGKAIELTEKAIAEIENQMRP